MMENPKYNASFLQKRIDELAIKYKNKKIMLYGAGKFFTEIYSKCDFSKLNVVGISDIKFSSDDNKDIFGIKCISPDKILQTDFDILLTTVINPTPVIGFLNKITKQKNKIENLITGQSNNGIIQSFKEKLNRFKSKNNSADSLNIEINEHLKNIEKKLSMPDGIWQIDKVKFYLPYYPVDLIQRVIVNNNSYFEHDILLRLDKYIPENAVILDIGANIGNHSLYWAMVSPKKVKKIYSFEPVKDTFNILKKNIEINNLQDKIIPYNVGLNNSDANADFLTYNRANIGDTHLAAGSGDMKLVRLDDIEFNEEHIDFIKMDVESMEVPALEGAKETLLKYKPEYIFIESEYRAEDIIRILNEYGYEKYEDYPQQNILFKLKK